MFRVGVRELVAGRLAAAQFNGLENGATISLRGSRSRVVETFEQHGSSAENLVLADGETVLSSLARNSYQHVTAVLTSPAAFVNWQATLARDTALAVDAMREADYVVLGIGGFAAVLDFVPGSSAWSWRLAPSAARSTPCMQPWIRAV